MGKISNKVEYLHASTNKTEGDINKYLLISDFGKTSFTSQEISSKKSFRVFEPVKPDKRRKLCLEYDKSFNALKDSLLDYPTTAAYKLNRNVNKEWIYYNRLISIHVPRCPLNCWHCFVEECYRNNCDSCLSNNSCDKSRRKMLEVKEDWFSAEAIIKEFLDQRINDLKYGRHTNILRITGGEPFLVPNLIVEVLEELKMRDLNNEILVLVETSLLPLCKYNEKTIVTDDLLNRMASFNNICVYPCFHGISNENFYHTTTEEIKLEYLFQALKRLISAGIDVYPSFGSNVTPIEEVENFYNALLRINKLLPLKFSLVEYDLNYEPIINRKKLFDLSFEKKIKLFNKGAVINKWNSLLQRDTGYSYGERPRHLVSV